MTVREQLEAKYGKPKTSPALPVVNAPYSQPNQGFINSVKGYARDAKQDIKQTFTALGKTGGEARKKIDEANKAYQQGEQGYTRTLLQNVGTLAGTLSSGIGDVAVGAVKTALPEPGEKKVKQAITSSTNYILPKAKKIDEALGQPAGSFMKKYKTLSPKTKRDIDSLLGAGSLAADLAGLGVAEKGVVAGKQTVKEVGEKVLAKGSKIASEITEETIPKLYKSGKNIAEKLGPVKPTALEATGNVLQGAKKDVKSGIKAFSVIDDLDKIKTYEQLYKSADKKIASLSKSVDEDLAKDTTTKKLGDLSLTIKTSSGKELKSEPVKNSLEQLRELYTKTDDIEELSNIEDLIEKANKVGLTNKDVNDISRKYGSEFKSKAFDKMGSPLTSVNAQMYENTRKRLKEIARSGIKGSEAKTADELMSNLYKVKELAEKNAKAVNKLRQKIQDRGLLEKVGHKISKYGDILTGGSIRGFVGGLLPRGAGYKTLNALDLEEALQKNLEIINKAIKSNSDEEIINLLK